jgi:hypothetical protein
LSPTELVDWQTASKAWLNKLLIGRKSVFRAQLSACKQEGRNVTVYSDEFLKLAKLVSFTAHDNIPVDDNWPFCELYINGLKASLQWQVRQGNPSKLSEARTLAEQAQSNAVLCGELTPHQKSFEIDRVFAVPMQRKVIECYHCGKQGHYKFQCRLLNVMRRDKSKNRYPQTDYPANNFDNNANRTPNANAQNNRVDRNNRRSRSQSRHRDSNFNAFNRRPTGPNNPNPGNHRQNSDEVNAMLNQFSLDNTNSNNDSGTDEVNIVLNDFEQLPFKEVNAVKTETLVHYVRGFINNRSVHFLVDSGASVSIINVDVLEKMKVLNSICPSQAKLTAANNGSFEVIGQIELSVRVEHIFKKHVFIAARNTPIEVILGKDFWFSNGDNELLKFLLD